MIPELIILALIIGVLIGGKLTRLADIQIKHVWLIFVPALMFVFAWIVASVSGISHIHWIYGTLHLTGIAALVVLSLINTKIPGAKLITIGLILNAIVICANGGFMPASVRSINILYGQKYAQQTMHSTHVRSSIMDSHTKLPVLCDIIPIKTPMKIFRGIYSIGDMFLSAGIFIAIILIMRTPLQKEAELDAV